MTTLRDDLTLNEPFDPETGDVSIHAVAAAIQLWCLLNERDMSVAECALAFNLTPEQVRDCVNAHYWMFLEGDEANLSACVIQHEGE